MMSTFGCGRTKDGAFAQPCRGFQEYSWENCDENVRVLARFEGRLGKRHPCEGVDLVACILLLHSLQCARILVTVAAVREDGIGFSKSIRQSHICRRLAYSKLGIRLAPFTDPIQTDTPTRFGHW
jgi:hypothetical protein